MMILTVSVFFILGVIFLVVGIIMIASLRNYFPLFYNKYKLLLLASTVCLTVPLFIRAADQLSLARSQAYSNFYFNHYYTTNSIYALLSTLLPCATQMASLIFGALRSDDKKIEQGIKSGSGEQNDEQDSSSDVSEEKSNDSFFDPQIQNYRFSYAPATRVNTSGVSGEFREQ